MYHKFLSGIPYVHHWPIKLSTSSTKKFYKNVKNHIPTSFKEKILDELLFYEILNYYGSIDRTHVKEKNEYELLDMLKTPEKIYVPQTKKDIYSILKNLDYPIDTLKYFPNLIDSEKYFNTSNRNMCLRHSLWELIFSSATTTAQMEKVKDILSCNIYAELDKQFFCGNRDSIKNVLSHISFPKKKNLEGQLILQHYYIKIPETSRETWDSEGDSEGVMLENPSAGGIVKKENELVKKYKVHIPKFLTDNPYFVKELYRILLGDLFLCKLAWSLEVNKMPSSDFILQHGTVDWFNKLFQLNHISHILGKYEDPITELLQKELISILLHLTMCEIMSRKNVLDIDNEITLLQEYVNSDKSAGLILSQCLDCTTQSLTLLDSGELKKYVTIPTYKVSLSKLKDNLRLRLLAQPELKNNLMLKNGIKCEESINLPGLLM